MLASDASDLSPLALQNTAHKYRSFMHYHKDLIIRVQCPIHEHTVPMCVFKYSRSAFLRGSYIHKNTKEYRKNTKCLPSKPNKKNETMDTVS